MMEIFRRKQKPTLNVGDNAEQAARNYLERQGLKLIEQNYRCKQGEIDLIMQDGETLVFVEVRYRNSTAFGSPLETVNRSKQRKITIATMHYLQKKGLGESLPVRFDVVGITPGNTDWIKGAF